MLFKWRQWIFELILLVQNIEISLQTNRKSTGKWKPKPRTLWYLPWEFLNKKVAYNIEQYWKQYWYFADSSMWMAFSQILVLWLKDYVMEYNILFHPSQTDAYEKDDNHDKEGARKCKARWLMK